ncbi:LCP family protein [Propionibacteriaceae bacterium Y1923]
MSDERNPDLDWLYRRDPEPDPEATQVLPPVADSPRRSGAAPHHPDGPGGTRIMPAVGGSSAGNWGAPPPPPPEPPRRQRRRRRRGFPLGRILLTLVLAYLVFMVATPLWHFTRGNTVQAMPAGERPADQPGRVFLLVGSDSRENLTDEQRRKYGTGTTDGARTDTILMLVIPESGDPALISLPRDSYLPIPGHGSSKLNAAYAWGGPQLLVQTVEQNTGVRIDGYLQIGMVGFAELVDAVGGIEVCLDAPMQDRDSHADFPAGCQDFDGVDALAYVRMRKADPTGDIGRMGRQREVIGKVAKKAVSPQTLLPHRWWAMNQVAGQLLVRDQDTSTLDVARAAMAFIDIAGGNGYQLVVPISDPNATTSAGSSMIWDEQRAAEMFALVKAGNTNGMEQFVR